jgi:hypothetical protein
MVARNLSRPHRFVCITDQDVPGVETVPLDRTTFVDGLRSAKLMLFRRDAGKLIGERILYLDLDCVIVGDLGPLVDTDAPIKIWANPHWRNDSAFGDEGTKRWAPFNSSMMLLTAGVRPDIYETFDYAKSRKIWRGEDQDWVSYHIGADWPHYWTEADGVHNSTWLPNARTGGPTTLPAGARIVHFPGRRSPCMPEIGRLHPWIEAHYR